MSRLSRHALVGTMVKVRALNWTHQEHLSSAAGKNEARASHAWHAKRQRACAEASQVREAVMTSINPPFTAQDYWNSYA